MKARTRDRLIGATAAVLFILPMMAVITIIDEQPAAQPIACIAPDLRDRVRDLMLEGFDAAFKDRVMHLYETWMKDPTDQPNRAAVGTRQAIRAWANSRRFVEQWNPPPCS